MDIERISAIETREKTESGNALLVLAYENIDKIKLMRLEGAISFDEFKSMLPEISKDREIIFY